MEIGGHQIWLSQPYKRVLYKIIVFYLIKIVHETFNVLNKVNE